MTQIRSKVRLVSKLFLQGRFEVPWHQRYYDWTEELVEELLVDLKEAVNEDRSSYFLGSIMLIARGENEWEINDGQQRLITLSLIFASLGRRFGVWGKREAPREIQCLRHLFAVEPHDLPDPADTTRNEPRIRPPRKDRLQFMQIIRGNDIGTNGKMTAAWNRIDLFVNAMNRPDVVQFFEFLTRKVEIAVLDVPPSEDANAVFEALNGRGKQLDDLDLIRNHLYSYFSASDDHVRRGTIHDALERAVIRNRTSQRAQEYFRCFLQRRYGYLQKARFYRETRTRIRAEASGPKGPTHVYDLINSLADPAGIELFRTMTATNPSPDLVSGFRRASGTSGRRRSLPDFLAELRTYRVVYPLLFALLYRYVTADDTAKRPVARAAHSAIRDMASFVMRVAFSTAKFEPSRYEAAFANHAREVAVAKDIEGMRLRTLLMDCDEDGIMNDARFLARMQGVQMKDERRAKRYLFAINANEQADASALSLPGCTLEHVLPRSKEHWADWTGFRDLGTDLSDWTLWPGNLTLMGRGDNHPGKRFNSSFDAKRAAFLESSFSITRRLGELEDWTPQVIQDRSTELAKAATRIWCFST